MQMQQLCDLVAYSSSIFGVEALDFEPHVPNAAVLEAPAYSLPCAAANVHIA